MRAVFLDRDGVLNKSVGKRPPNNQEELQLFPKVGQAIKKLNDAGYKVFVVTNQGGVGLGYMRADTLEEIHDRLRREVAEQGGHIKGIAACTHRPHDNCSCRKPNPGMLLDLANEHRIELAKSFMVGDRESDIEAGERAGTRTVFIGSNPECEPDYIAPNLWEATLWIIEQ